MIRLLRNISLATRLAMVALLVTLVSLSATAAVGLDRGSDLTDEVVDRRLVAVAASQATSVEASMRSIRRELGALASSAAVAADIGELRDAVVELTEADPSPAIAAEVAEFYLTAVAPDLAEVRGDVGGDVAGLVPTGAAALALQAAYTVPTETEAGTTFDPELIVDAGDGSDYSALHAELHRTYSSIAARSDLDDLLLIDATTESVVYSYRKRIDFGTSLELGPHSGSALARTVDLVSRAPDRSPMLSAFSRYVPANEEPTTFLVAAVRDDADIVGYLAYAISHEWLGDLLAGEDRWSAFGESGEAFLVDGDAVMITTARSYEERPVAYRQESLAPGPGQLTDDERLRLVGTGTTALVQRVPSELVIAAREAPGIVDTNNYRGTAVRTVYSALDVEGVEWTLLVEAPTSELDGTIEEYARDMLIAVALFVVAITFIVVRWSTRLVSPIRAIANRLRRARSSEPADAALVASQTEHGTADEAGVDQGPTEFVDLAVNVDEMLAALRSRQVSMAERRRERTALLQQFLPAAIARRSEQADGEVLDHVRQASVAVIRIDGLGELVGTSPDQEVRDLLAELIEEIDGEAADAGVERVKLTGSTYFAVCGAGRPLLDHAPRTVGFALRAAALVADASGGRLAARVGVAEGPVSVGLAERSALVYDAWGETVRLAEELSRSAGAGAVVVSEPIVDHLPEGFEVDVDDSTGHGVVSQTMTDGVVS